MAGLSAFTRNPSKRVPRVSRRYGISYSINEALELMMMRLSLLHSCARGVEKSRPSEINSFIQLTCYSSIIVLGIAGSRRGSASLCPTIASGKNATSGTAMAVSAEFEITREGNWTWYLSISHEPKISVP